MDDQIPFAPGTKSYVTMQYLQLEPSTWSTCLASTVSSDHDNHTLQLCHCHCWYDHPCGRHCIWDCPQGCSLLCPGFEAAFCPAAPSRNRFFLASAHEMLAWSHLMQNSSCEALRHLLTCSLPFMHTEDEALPPVTLSHLSACGAHICLNQTQLKTCVWVIQFTIQTTHAGSQMQSICKQLKHAMLCWIFWVSLTLLM